MFLTFYLKTNKVKNQIYTKLTVKTAETDSKIDSKKPKKSDLATLKTNTPLSKKYHFSFGAGLREMIYNLEVLGLKYFIYI